jgi:molecular chaperone DnaJ
MSKDYYQILGVAKNATVDEIKKAYYKMAHQHHPHKGGSEAKMKEINEAYSVLGNPEKRSQYDQYGQTFEQARSQGGFSGFNGFRDFSDFAEAFGRGQGQQNGFSFEFGDLGDVFGDLFGFGGKSKSRAGRRNQGADIELAMTIDFKEAVFGTEKTITLNKDEACPKCKGSGAEVGSKNVTCSTCRGTGQVMRSIGFGIGFPSACPDCNGLGQKAEKECSQCRGKGVIKNNETFTVKIPAGIDDGQTIRLAGRGQAGAKGGNLGDLYLKMRVLPDPRFKRDGYDIKTKTEISIPQAVLGSKIEIETVDGKVTLKIPEGTPSGKVFQIKGKGVPHLQSKNRGDHLVEVIIKIPNRLSRKQKELFQELNKEL